MKSIHIIYFFPFIAQLKPAVEAPQEISSADWWMPLCRQEQLNDLKHSGKLVLLFSVLAMCETLRDKLVVFSQSLFSLDLIEHFLQLIDENTRKPNPNAMLGGFKGEWKKGTDYFRLDGKTTTHNRHTYCKEFNREENVKARLVSSDEYANVDIIIGRLVFFAVCFWYQPEQEASASI